MTSSQDNSLWQHSCQETVAAKALTGATTADLLVIGGGYTGCSAALKAAELGAEVCLLEAEDFGYGGSGRNVGLANAGLWLPPNEIEDRLGTEHASRLSTELAAAPDLVYGLIEKHEISCEATRQGTLHCAHAPAGMRDLEDRYSQLRANGAPVELLPANEARQRVGTDQIHGALFDPRAGTIQPLGYAKGLARAAAQAGARLHCNSPVVELSRDRGLWQAKTANGGRVSANKIIMATNAYAGPIKGFANPSVVPVHFFQAATKPLTPTQLEYILPGLEGCWDTGLVMSSWRLDQAGRLVIGAMGALEHFASGIHTNWLRRKTSTLFPALKDPDFEFLWAGRIAMTGEYLPKILEIEEGLACFGYSGRGIGPGTVFGSAMAEALITGNKDVLPVPTSRDHQLPIAGLRSLYYETGATLTHLVKDRV